MQYSLSKSILFIFGLLALLLMPGLSYAQWKLISPDCAFPASKRYFNNVADDQPITNSKAKAAIALPASSTYAVALAHSEEAYALGSFWAAAEELKLLANQKSVAPAVLNQYARSLYQMAGGKARSFTVYQRLIALLNQYGGENSSTCVLYLPFQESYYKLATLQMDNEQWAAAAYNISRTLMAFQALPGQRELNMALYEEALQYQTECFANLGETKLCRHFGQRTLKLFPQNQYVKQYLNSLPPATAKPASQKRAAPAMRR